MLLVVSPVDPRQEFLLELGQGYTLGFGRLQSSLDLDELGVGLVGAVGGNFTVPVPRTAEDYPVVVWDRNQ